MIAPSEASPTDAPVDETVGAALAAATMRLAAAGLDAPRREARLLIAAALGTDLAGVMGYPERRLDAAEAAQLAALVERRRAREPAARLLGQREFWSLSFGLSAETLVPRPDSETLIEAALALLPDRSAALRVLDLGCGSGCLLLALLSELPEATGLGIDIAPGAAATARRNALSLGLDKRARFVVGSWGAAISGRFDVILANPPYISSGAIADLAPEVVLYEPRAALDGGADGLAAYRALARDLPGLLAENGLAFIELGAGQADDVAAVMRDAGLNPSGRRRDLSGIERCLVIRPGEAVPDRRFARRY